MNESLRHLSEVGEVVGEYAKGALVFYLATLATAGGLGAILTSLKKRNALRSGVDEETDEYRRED